MTEADPAVFRGATAGQDRRRLRLASPRTAVAAGVVFAVVALALVPLSLLARQSPEVNGGEALGAVPFGVVGFVLARRLPRNPIGWIFLAIAICLLLSIDSGFYAVISYPLGHHLPLGPAALFLYELWGPALSLFALVVFLFPDGTLSGRSSRAVLCLFVAVLVGFTAALGVAVANVVAGHHIVLDSYDGLAAIDSATGWFARAQLIFALIGLPAIAWGGARQVVAWRRSSGERRQQLKWLASGVVIAVAGLVFGLAVPGDASAAERAVANVVSNGIVALPVSIGIAVLRYRLYEIDRIISRTLAYAIVTGLLVGVYAGLVVLTTQVFRFHTEVAVAAATLVAAALVNPVRRRVQRAVDRRFNRARYDADRIVAAFAAGLRGAVDLAALGDSLAGAVQQALEPAHQSIWLNDRRLAAPSQTWASS
jgi:hypothetical protein